MSTQIEEFERLTKERETLNSSISAYSGQLTSIEQQIQGILEKHGVSSVEELEAKKVALDAKATDALKTLREENTQVAAKLEEIRVLMSQVPSESQGGLIQ